MRTIKKFITVSIFFLVTVTFAGISCSHKVTMIPEVSNALSHSDISDLSGKSPVRFILENDSNLTLVTQQGEIFQYNFKTNMVDFLYPLNRPVEPGIIHQNDLLVLTHPAGPPSPSSDSVSLFSYTIFDLKQMREISFLEKTRIKKILGIDHTCLVYLSRENEVEILKAPFNTNPPSVLKPAKTFKLEPKLAVFNSQWRRDRLFFLTSQHVCIYDKTSSTLETIKLKQPAASDFLLEDGHLYYGSVDRELVRFSLKSRKTRWAFKLPDVLSIQPQKIGPYVVIIPEDNNIYFFNKNGSLYWWEKLDSSRKLSPKMMEKNAVVFLWDRSIKFFNYKKKQVLSYPFNRYVTANPVIVGEHIYIVSSEKDFDIGDETQIASTPFQLSKIGNNYGAIIETEPQQTKLKGQSIRFQLVPVNLVDPAYSVKIFPAGADPNQPPLIQKTIPAGQTPSFVWVPMEDREYRLAIEINAKNRKGIVMESYFNVIDIEKLIRDYHNRIQDNCVEGVYIY